MNSRVENRTRVFYDATGDRARADSGLIGSRGNTMLVTRLSRAFRRSLFQKGRARVYTCDFRSGDDDLSIDLLRRYSCAIRVVMGDDRNVLYTSLEGANAIQGATYRRAKTYACRRNVAISVVTSYGFGSLVLSYGSSNGASYARGDFYAKVCRARRVRV